MTSILLMLLLPVVRAQRVFPVPACPASCLVCSDDAVICHRLNHIIDAPYTTQALLLTEGSISAVQPASLSDLSNITVIGLSHNRISVLGKESFRNLPFLHTLLLDHNLLTSQALQGGALSDLTRLEVLALGHNLISMFQAGWLNGTKALRSLNLEGNLLTSLDSSSFHLKDLRDLESLDVSDNRLSHLDGNSFHGLVGLRSLDLSRNRLSSAPAEAFSYLSWLTNLNLDLNSWNCSCQLLELAAFLSAFIQQPDQTLYNGRRMVCVSADNPAVTTVLELTEANCVPSNQNITVQVQTSGSVTPQLYARDLAITAVICFIGGVGLTLLVVLIYFQVSRRKKLKEREGQREKEEGRSTVANHLVNQHDVSEKRRDLFLQANNSQPWDEDAMMLDARTEGKGGQFRCPECSVDAPRLNAMRWDGKMNGGMESEEDRERRRGRMMMMMEERRNPGTHQEILGRDISNKFPSHSNSSSSYPWRETLGQRPESHVAYKAQREMGESYRTGVEGKSRGQEMTHCESCHRTYRPSEHNMRQGRIHTNMRDSHLFEGFLTLNRPSDRNVDYNQFDMMKHTDLRRETRNVKFDLESSRTRNDEGSGQGEVRREQEVKTPTDKDRGRERKHKAKALKVKLNLNPLRKSKVHPKRKSEHSEKSPKKSKEKRRNAKETGEKDGKGSSSKKTKESSKHVKKSAKNKGLFERDSEEEEEEKDRERKSKAVSKQKKAISKSVQGGQEGAEGDQGEKTEPENSKQASSDTTNPADKSHTKGIEGVSVIGQGAGAGLDLKSALPQQPFPLSASERIHTTNLSLLGPAASLLTGSNLSLQGGNLLLNAMAPVTTDLYQGVPANNFNPSIGISGSNMVLSGAPDSFGRQTRVSLMSPATTHLLNTAQPNLLQASSIQTAPHTQTGGIDHNLAANPTVLPTPIQSLSQSQMPPDSIPLVGRLKPEPAQGSGLKIGEGLHHLSPQSQTMETPTLPTQTPIGTYASSEVIPQVTAPMTTVTTVTTVENLSNNNSQTDDGHVPGGSSVSTSAGGMVLTEGLAMGVSGGSMAAVADMSVSGVSVQSGSSTGSALLQQEYLSEDGGSSPRRKLRLVLPEKTSSRPPTALERKIR